METQEEFECPFDAPTPEQVWPTCRAGTVMRAACRALLHYLKQDTPESRAEALEGLALGVEWAQRISPPPNDHALLVQASRAMIAGDGNAAAAYLRTIVRDLTPKKRRWIRQRRSRPRLG